MHKPSKTGFLLLFLSFLNIACSQPRESENTQIAKSVDGKFDLRYAQMQGTSFTLTFTRKDHYVREIFGNEIIVNSDDRIEYGFKVESVENEGTTLEVEYKNRMHESDNQQVQARPDFSSLIGEKAELFLSSTGRMSEFESFDDLPEIEVPDQGMALDENRYILEIQQLFPILADHPVGIGDAWTAVQEFEEPLPAGNAQVVVTTKYAVLEETKKDGVACLKIEGEINATVTGTGELQAMPFDLKMIGAGKSIVYFAYKKGMLLEVVEDVRVKGEAVITEEDVDMTLPVDHTFHTEIEVRI